MTDSASPGTPGADPAAAPTARWAGRALVVSPTAETGALLAREVDDALLVQPAGVEAALAAEGASFAHVAALDLGEELAAVLETVRQGARDDVLLLLASTSRDRLLALTDATEGLWGFALVGVALFAGLPCLVLRRAGDAVVPDLAGVPSSLAALPAPTDGSTVGPHAEERVRQLEAELATAHEQATDARAEVERQRAQLEQLTARPDQAASAGLLARLRRTRRPWLLAGVAVAALVVAGALAAAAAAITGGTAAEGLMTALLLLVLVAQAYLVRAFRRQTRADGRFARRVRKDADEARRAATAVVRRDQDASRQLARQGEHLLALERQIALAAAAAVDTAHGVAALRQELEERSQPG